MKPRPKFTDLQGQYLAFTETYTTLHGVAPAEADMQRFFCVTPPTVHRMVLTLEQRGLIERIPGRSREHSVAPYLPTRFRSLRGMERTAPSNPPLEATMIDDTLAQRHDYAAQPL
jgi:repressor LexA